MSKREEQRIEREIHKVSKSHDPFAAAVRTTRMPMLVTDPHQPDNPIVFVNDAFIRLTGYQRNEIMGRNCRFLQGTGTNFEDVARVRNAIARREAIEIDLLNYRKDGSSFWNRLLVSPVFDENGDLTYFFASQFDVSPDRRRIEELNLAHGAMENEIERRMQDLMQSESRMRFILNASGMGVWTLDLRTERLVASAHCKANFGREPDEPFTYEDLKASVHHDDRERWRQVVVGAIVSGSEFDIEYRVLTPNGEVRWIEVRGQTTLSSTDEPVTLAGISIDVTARREAEEHRKLLARELNHRVKNSLAMVQSIIARSLRTASTLEEAQKIAFGRIGAMASAQDALTTEGWSSADLRTVVEGALKPFERSKFTVDGPRVVLNEQAVSALALALHELATNATKYGALSTDAGSVTIHWEVVSSDIQTLKFHWTETNGPRVHEPARRGFGSRLIEDVVATSMNGRAQINFTPTGVQYEIEAALPENIDGVATE